MPDPIAEVVVADLLRSPETREKLEYGCLAAAADHTVEEMVERFAGGIEDAPARTA